MTFTNYLATLSKANPRLFVADKIQMTVAVFEEQLRRAFDAGCDSMRRPPADLPEGFESLFGNLRR